MVRFGLCWVSTKKAKLGGCKAFGETPEIALRELEAVKEGFIDLFLEMGKPIPELMIHHRDTPVKHKNNGFTGQAEDTEKRQQKTL